MGFLPLFLLPQESLGVVQIVLLYFAFSLTGWVSLFNLLITLALFFILINHFSLLDTLILRGFIISTWPHIFFVLLTIDRWILSITPFCYFLTWIIDGMLLRSLGYDIAFDHFAFLLNNARLLLKVFFLVLTIHLRKFATSLDKTWLTARFSKICRLNNSMAVSHFFFGILFTIVIESHLWT